MMRAVIGCVVLGTLSVVGVVSAGGAREEQQRLQGSYEMVELGYVGKAKGFKGLQKKIEIIGDRMNYSAKTVYVLRFAPTWNPKRVDLILSTGVNKDKVYKGIYRWEKDTLTIHFTITGDRPANFQDTGGDNKTRMMVLKRVNSDK